jgi:hypothetical protein
LAGPPSNFIVLRMEMAPDIGLEPTCPVGQTRMFVDLKDTTTGDLARDRVCLPLAEADVRDQLAPLTAHGYTPNDWD